MSAKEIAIGLGGIVTNRIRQRQERTFSVLSPQRNMLNRSENDTARCKPTASGAEPFRAALNGMYVRRLSRIMSVLTPAPAQDDRR